MLGQADYSEHVTPYPFRGLDIIKSLGDAREAVSYSTWHNGDIVYVVCFDEDDKVVAAMSGTT